MISDLYRLRDLLTALEYDPEDEFALIDALDLIESLIVAVEKPTQAKANACMRVPTPPPPVPVAPVAPPPAEKKPHRFVDQTYSEKKPRKPRQKKVKPNAA